MSEPKEFKKEIEPGVYLRTTVTDGYFVTTIYDSNTREIEHFSGQGERFGVYTHEDIDLDQLLSIPGTRIDADGTIHFSNGTVWKPVGEHGEGKPNRYDTFLADGTKIEPYED